MILTITLLTTHLCGYAQAGVGIGVSDPDPSAVLHIQPPSRNKGILIPRLTSLELGNIADKAEGLMAYNETVGEFYYYSTFNGVGSWEPIGTPRGAIIMWSGTTLPKGWALCDGTNGTPDLRERFIVGAGNDASLAGGPYAIGNKGGYHEITLTVQQMPAHDHPASSSPHSHSELRFIERSSNWRAGGDDSPGNGTGESIGATTGAATVNVTVGTRGGGEAHENRPPYYALAFIIKL